MKPIPYTPRPIRPLEIHHRDGWDLKLYSVTLPGEVLDRTAFDRQFGAVVRPCLPLPDPAAGRPGLGFAIFHQGRGMDYLVLCWWDRENEIFNRVWTRPRGIVDAEWSQAQGGETACVWDLLVIGYERDAYVDTLLGSNGPDREGYLSRRFSDHTDL